jgi:hypothetical protein
VNPPGHGRAPWDVFQGRIKAAISRAAGEYDTVVNLAVHLRICEEALREPGLDLRDEEAPRNPVATELRTALENHKSKDPAQFDSVCAANVVLAVTQALVNQRHRL